MTLSYDQFKIVLADRDARSTAGLFMSDEQAGALLANEAQALAWHTAWTRGGQQLLAAAPAALPNWVGFVRWIGPALLLAIAFWMLAIAVGMRVESRAGYLENVGDLGYDGADAFGGVMWALGYGPQLVFGGVSFGVLAVVWFVFASISWRSHNGLKAKNDQ